MSITQSIQTVVTTPAGVFVNGTSNLSDTDEVVFNGTIAATTTNFAMDLAFPYATLTSIVLFSDQAVNLYTNAVDGTGGNHITLAAGVPLTWDTNSPFANPFTHIVTVMYGNNAGSTIANVKISAVFH